MTIDRFVTEQGLEGRIADALVRRGCDPGLFGQIAEVPVLRSHAVRRLGSYVTKGGEPVAIRLQFVQEEMRLVETFLHELAHLFDHVTNQQGKPYRRAHGEGWRQWAQALQIAPELCGDSEALRQLHIDRLKVVAVCKRCGFELKRLRRLPRRRRYSHVDCGGTFRPC